MLVQARRTSQDATDNEDGVVQGGSTRRRCEVDFSLNYGGTRAVIVVDRISTSKVQSSLSVEVDTCFGYRSL